MSPYDFWELQARNQTIPDATVWKSAVVWHPGIDGDGAHRGTDGLPIQCSAWQRIFATQA
ncbi:hypothetical protein GCM10027400_13700 [Pseudoxanthomonas daejeonensis]